MKPWPVFMLISCLSLSVSAQMNIASKLEELKPLQAGDPAPSFTVYKVDGGAFNFVPTRLEHPTMIIFYRGGWCGACNQQLRDLSSVVPEIKQMGVDIIFPNGDRPEILYSSLRQETKIAIEGLGYTLLSDSDLNAAQAFSVAYVLDDEILKRYRAREEWDLYMSSIDKYDALPLPSIYIVDTNGKIAFNYYNLDPTFRLSAADLKAAVEKIMAQH
jgi:peroxiredoxin